MFDNDCEGSAIPKEDREMEKQYEKEEDASEEDSLSATTIDGSR